MGKDIPVVLGGFGTDKKCISDKTIAEIHGQPVFKIRERITDNIKRFQKNIDYIDLEQRIRQTDTLELLKNLGYAKQSITQAQHIYLLSERGYAKLIKIMDTDLAWEIHDKLIDEYFELREWAQYKMTYEEAEEFLTNPNTILRITTNWKEERDKRIMLEAKIEADAPKVEVGEAVLDEDGNIELQDFHKLCTKRGTYIGRTNLYKCLRDLGYLEINQYGKNAGTQKSIDEGLMIVDNKVFVAKGRWVGNTNTKITKKGQDFLVPEVAKWKNEEMERRRNWYKKQEEMSNNVVHHDFGYVDEIM